MIPDTLRPWRGIPAWVMLETSGTEEAFIAAPAAQRKSAAGLDSESEINPNLMPAKYPKQISIGGQTVDIRIDPELDSWGEYHADDKEIVLATKTLSKASSLRETLRHEMLHASLDIAGLSYLKNFEEEAVVRCIDSIFHPAWEAVRKQLTP